MKLLLRCVFRQIKSMFVYKPQGKSKINMSTQMRESHREEKKKSPVNSLRAAVVAESKVCPTVVSRVKTLRRGCRRPRWPAHGAHSPRAPKTSGSALLSHSCISLTSCTHPSLAAHHSICRKTQINPKSPPESYKSPHSPCRLLGRKCLFPLLSQRLGSLLHSPQSAFY